MYIAAWVNTAESGKKYMSLSFSAPDAKYNMDKDSSATPKPEFEKTQTSNDLPF